MKNTIIYGERFQVADQPADFWGWVEEGRYDGEWAILKSCLRPEHTFLDIGAWVGSHSLYASTKALCVLAVEPDPVAYSILAENAKANPGNIHTFPIAIAGYEGTILLGSGWLGASTTRANPSAGAGIGPWEPGQQVEVPCTTLRQFVEAHNEPKPLFIKMDVEGSEEQILQDLEFFKTHKPSLYIELHPFWWTDEKSGWETVRKVAALYGHEVGSEKPKALLLTP
jgi:FkbM family methyltransferase